MTESPAPMTPAKKNGPGRFFLRGLGTLLPMVLTVWLVVIAYNFVDQKVAAPLNAFVRTIVLTTSPFPEYKEEDLTTLWNSQDEYAIALRDTWEKRLLDVPVVETERREARISWMQTQPEIQKEARRIALKRWWNQHKIGNIVIMDFIGLILAIMLFYLAGVLISNVIGRRLKEAGERAILNIPLIKNIYPSIKQVTEFFFTSEEKKKPDFSKVIAVQYPRKGIWSVGLVTGDTMQSIENAMGEKCLTVFIPSSPTPFTGYVITVAKSDTIELDIAIEDAIKFTVSGGVVIPPIEQIHREKQLES